MSIDFRQVATIAAKEFWDRIRNRWVFVTAAVFAVFALAIAYFGARSKAASVSRGLKLR